MNQDNFKSQGPQISVRMMPGEQALGGNSIGSAPVRTQVQPARGQQVPRLSGGAGGKQFTPAQRTEVQIQPGAVSRLSGGIPDGPPVAAAPARAPQAPAPQAPPAPERPQFARRPMLGGDDVEKYLVVADGQGPDGKIYRTEYEGIFPRGTKILGTTHQKLG